jgi:hypothetical protein
MESDQIVSVQAIEEIILNFKPGYATCPFDNSGDALESPASLVIQDVDAALVVEIEFWEVIGRFAGPAVILVPEDESRILAVAQVLDHHLGTIIYSLCSTLAIRSGHDTMLHHIIFPIVLFILSPISHITRTSHSTRKHHLGLASPRPLRVAVNIDSQDTGLLPSRSSGDEVDVLEENRCPDDR